jgi:hypothetical protein
MFLRFSHVAFINASFLFMAELYSIENCMDVPCFAYSLIDGHQVVSTFWVLWIVLLWTLCMPVWICFELFWVSYLSYWSLHGSWNAQVEAAPLRNHGSSKLEAHPLCSCRAFLHITLILGAVPQITHGPLLPDRGALLQEPQLSTCSSGVKWKTNFKRLTVIAYGKSSPVLLSLSVVPVQSPRFQPSPLLPTVQREYGVLGKGPGPQGHPQALNCVLQVPLHQLFTVLLYLQCIDWTLVEIYLCVPLDSFW